MERNAGSKSVSSQMVERFNLLHPGHAGGCVIGSEIVRRILSQPGCCGVRFFNAADGSGVETLVYAGVDAAGVLIRNGMICDRTKPPPPPPSIHEDGWGLPE